ncbi:hypothetical protein DFH28DRAFT_1104341 [Melampsora americana]|nr:hypothetical protein DFH28DRAFT_1104341 [Melampsora americana]
MNTVKLKYPKGLHPHDLPPEFLNRPAAYLTQLFEEGGPGTIIQLAQSSIWELETLIKISANRSELSTFGYPIDPSLQAQLHSIQDPTAISFYETHNVKISHVTVDGRRPDKGWVENGSALIVCGGRQAKDPVIQYCTLRHPRGWSCLHLFNMCSGGRVIGNKIGPAGSPAPNGPWADGLSIACRNGLIVNNEIVDATDGAIVLFCTPGTICTGNTIIARTQNLLGAINMVDAGPYEMDYTDTRVFGNIIKSEGAHIKLGIGIGPLAWAPGPEQHNFGGQVHDNVFGPGRFGYAIGISGAKNFSVRGNSIAAGTEFTGDMTCMPEPLNAPPMAFLANSNPDLVVDCDLQSEFKKGRACWLIGIEDGPIRKLRYDPEQLHLQSNSFDHSQIILDKITLKLQDDGLLVVICNSTQSILWSSGRSGASGGASLTLSDDGRLAVRENASGRLIWDPTDYLDGKVELGRSSLTIADQSPFLVLWTGDNCVAWASEYVFPKGGLELVAGQYICIPPHQPRRLNHVTQPPPIPPRPQFGNPQPPMMPPRPSQPTYLYLDPDTSNLVLHQGRLPTQPHGSVIWASEFFPKFNRQVKSMNRPNCQTRCCFQEGDGNLVIYGNPDESKPTERTALWASGTESHWIKLDQHLVQQQHPPSLSFHNHMMELVRKIP